MKASKSIEHYHFSTPDVVEHFFCVNERFLSLIRNPNNRVIVDAKSPFPISAEGGSLGYPDLLHLLQFDGVFFDLRVIVLHRDPLEAIFTATRQSYSSHHRPFQTLEYQARVVEEGLAYLNNALMMVPCTKQLWIDFDCFTHDLHQYDSQLARFLNVPEMVLRGLSQVEYKPENNEIFMKEDVRIIRDFISAHEGLWPNFVRRPHCDKGAVVVPNSLPLDSSSSSQALLVALSGA